ncbi:putative protein phosphatase 2C 67 [Apostasia shenzhenica]|uniref:protein-serine/threonine phosphatase n=1 Tax=Apostasia shenzhenica TaxID=1088818 RepID=A0A2H9ZQS5_9ASPA|nr:putative protein phosphatase 2C 67 [Apostasia shenzhenica]
MLSNMADQKREADFEDETFITKKSKVTEVGAVVDPVNMVKEKKGKCNCDVSDVDGTSAMSILSNAENERNLEGKMSYDIDNRISISERIEHDSFSQCSKEAPDELLNNLCSIEADAAEDKGSRHTMEDAWVVLHDAKLDSPGNLRCAHFAIYDGHGGRLAAEFAKKYLHANVLAAGLPHGYKSCEKDYN